MADKARLNIPLDHDKLEQYKRQARAAGFSTLAEYVRHVLDGRVLVSLEEAADPGTRGRGRPARARE